MTSIDLGEMRAFIDSLLKIVDLDGKNGKKVWQKQEGKFNLCIHEVLFFLAVLVLFDV